MRLYENKFFQKDMRRRFASNTWGIDAIVWDIDEANYKVRCKIQGSNEYILCHYPRNWQTLPPWCKRGNAVRIAKKNGLQGFFEVLGHGRAIPSPVSGNQLPTAETLFDGVLTGGSVEPYSGMTVEVGATTYRIDGLSYTADLTGAIMGSTTPEYVMGVDLIVMGGDSAYLTLDAAPSVGQFRYDLIVAGTDNVIEIVKGTASATPAMPDTPSDHVKIAHVFIPGGTTTITDAMINALWEERRLVTFSVALANGSGTIDVDGQFVWSIAPATQTPYCRITFTMIDQYGWTLTSPDYSCVLSLLIGSGGISLTTADFDTADLTKTSSSGSVFIYYQRDQTGAEVSPVIQLNVSSGLLLAAHRIPLLDSGGSIIA